MKKKLLLFLLMATTISVWASKPYSHPVVFTQPDGTQITVRHLGDQFLSYYVASDGTILSRRGNEFFVAHIDEQGNITPSKTLAHDPAERSAAERKLVSAQNRAAFYADDAAPRQAARRHIAVSTSASPRYVPHKGNPKIAVILTEFQDTTFMVENPQALFTELFNGAGSLTTSTNALNRNYSSVKQYFRDMSNAEFSPEFEVVGPVKVSNNMAYYGGSSETNSSDEKSSELTLEAVNLAKDLLDFSQFDYDGDGTIDLVYILYAGYMQNMDGVPETVWAKASWTSSSVGGKSLGRYCMSGERINPAAPSYITSIGVICHEFSHCLGLPDVYPYNAEAKIDNQEMEMWDLMDGGEYTNNGWRPTPYTAWEKEAMGWAVDIQPLTAETKSVQMGKSTLEGGTAYKILNPNDQDEYFMVERIDQKGWNQKAPGAGVLVYKVKYPAQVVNMGDHPNATPGKPGMAVVPASGRLMSSWSKDNVDDAYKLSNAAAIFNPTNGLVVNDVLGLPNFCWYTEPAATNKALSMTFEGDMITLNYTDDVASGIEAPQALRPSTADGGIFTLDGRLAGYAAETLPAGIYIKNNKKIVINRWK